LLVAATKYIVIAQILIDWKVMKTQLPINTPKPLDSILQPDSLIFNENVNAIADMSNYGQWWR
jgi:hypothetical protein